MGGISSSRWAWEYTSKSTVESKCAVSVHYLNKQGCLFEGSHGSLSWSCGDAPLGSVGYNVKANGIQFSYRSRRSDYADWENIELFIQFDYTACHYGNQRTWLLCPQCQQRVAVMYCEDGNFQCRKCSQLNYRTQHENRAERQSTKAQRIRRKLGGDVSMANPFPDKPKGMHWPNLSTVRG